MLEELSKRNLLPVTADEGRARAVEIGAIKFFECSAREKVMLGFIVGRSERNIRVRCENFFEAAKKACPEMQDIIVIQLFWY